MTVEHETFGPVVNFYFAQMVLSKKANAQFMDPLGQPQALTLESIPSHEDTYIGLTSFEEALAFDQADIRKTK